MIEVEKKFLISDDKIAEITKNSDFIGVKDLVDSYYDTKDFKLTTKDWWLRNRNGKFELKVSIQGSKGSIDQYDEIDDEKEICQYLKIDFGNSLLNTLARNKITPFAKIISQRKKFKKGEFTLDFDITDFGYSICEIELLVKDKSEIDYTAKRIENFAKEINLENKPVRGKLIEYIYRNRSEHYRALVKAGVIIA